MKSDRFVAISGNDPDAYFANSAMATRLAPSNVEISNSAAAPSQAAGAAGPRCPHGPGETGPAGAAESR